MQCHCVKRAKEEMKAAQREVNAAWGRQKTNTGRKWSMKLRENNMREVWEGVRTITGHKAKTSTEGEGVERENDLNYFFSKFSHSTPLPRRPQPTLRTDYSLPTAQRSVWRIPSSTSNTEPTRIWTREAAQSGSSSWTSRVQEKLIRMWMDPCLVAWISSYLTNRQFVRLKDITSDTVVSSIRAPQGTVLSPLLFTLYAADFCHDFCHNDLATTSRSSQMTRPSWGVSETMKRRNTGAWWGTLLSGATQTTCSSTTQRLKNWSSTSGGADPDQFC